MIAFGHHHLVLQNALTVGISLLHLLVFSTNLHADNGCINRRILLGITADVEIHIENVIAFGQFHCSGRTECQRSRCLVNFGNGNGSSIGRRGIVLTAHIVEVSLVKPALRILKVECHAVESQLALVSGCVHIERQHLLVLSSNAGHFCRSLRNDGRVVNHWLGLVFADDSRPPAAAGIALVGIEHYGQSAIGSR